MARKGQPVTFGWLALATHFVSYAFALEGAKLFQELISLHLNSGYGFEQGFFSRYLRWTKSEIEIDPELLIIALLGFTEGLPS